MARRETHACPNCAAALAVPAEHERFFRCDHCGTVIEDRDADALAVAPPDVPPDVVLVSYGRPRRRGGAILAAAVLLAAGVAMVPVLLTSTVVSTSVSEQLTVDTELRASAALTSVQLAELVSSDDDTSPDVLVHGYAAGGGGALLLIDRESDGGVRWLVEVDEPDPNGVLAVDREHVVAALDGTLLLLNRGNGAVIAEVPLSDGIAPYCVTCLRLVDDVAVTLTDDGVLSAHALGDGTQRWQVTLTELPRQLLLLGGRPAVVDDPGDGGRVQVYDPVDGTLVASVPASCEDGVFGGQEPVHPYDQLVELPDAGLVVASMLSDEGCLARWDGDATAATWETRFTVGGSLDGISDETTRHDGTVLVHAEGGDAVAVSLADGGLTPLVSASDEELFPLAVSGDTAVLASHSTRGSGSWRLLGVGVDGAQRWSFDVSVPDALELSPGGWAADEAWFSERTSQGLTLATWRTEDTSLVLQTLPLASGTASSPVTVQLPGSLIPRLEPVGAHGDTLIVTLDGAVYGIDVTDGTVERWL